METDLSSNFSHFGSSGGWREKFLLALFLNLSFAASIFLAGFFYEVLGRGLLALLAGGEFYGFYLSPLISSAFIFLPAGTPPWAVRVVSMGGLVMNLFLGILALILYLKLRNLVVRGFFWALSLVSLLSGLGYLAADSVLGVAGGDVEYLLQLTRASPLVLALIALFLALFVGYQLHVRALHVLQDYFALDSLAHSLPLSMSLALPGGVLWLAFLLLARSSLSRALFTYDLIFLLLFTAVLLSMSALAAPAFGKSEREPSKGVPKMSLLVGSFVLLLFIVGTVAFFGLLPSTARALLIAPPPPEVETGILAYNLEIKVERDLSATITLKMRPVTRDPASPLMRQIEEASVRAEVNWEVYLARARESLNTVLGTEDYKIVEKYGDGSLWYGGKTYQDARGVVVQLNLRGSPILVERGRGIYQLSVQDPLLPKGGYLDLFQISLGPETDLIDYRTEPQEANQPEVTDEGRVLTWRNRSLEESPAIYKIEFRAQAQDLESVEAALALVEAAAAWAGERASFLSGRFSCSCSTSCPTPTSDSSMMRRTSSPLRVVLS